MSVFQVGGQEYRLELSAGGVEHGHVRRQFQLARTRLDAGERAHYPGPGELLFIFLRRQLQNRMPHGVRQAERPLYGGTGKFQSDPLWRDNIYFLNTSMAPMVPGPAPVTKPAGPDSLPRQKRGYCGSTKSAIVVPTRSWREISWWKTQQTQNSLNFASTCLKVVDTRRVAVARKLAVLLHRRWVSGEVYEPLHNSQKVMNAAA
jgi:hypothetical protein